MRNEMELKAFRSLKLESPDTLRSIDSDFESEVEAKDDQSGGANTMLPIGVRIKVRSTSNLRKRSSGAATTSKKNSSAVKTARSSHKKQVPPPRKFLRTSKERAAKLAKREAKKQASEERQYHVLSRRPAWADDQGVFYGIYGSYYHQKIQQKRNKKYVDSDDMSEETKMKLQEEQQKASQAHRRWLKKNKVTDALTGKFGKNVSNKKPTRNKPRDGGAGILLYVGFLLTVIGLILTVVGAGEDGFKSPELGLIGPSLIGMGAFFAFLRVLTCTCHDKCARLCPRFCPPPSNQQTKPLLQPVQTQPTTVASAEEPQQMATESGAIAARDSTTAPLLEHNNTSVVVEGASVVDVGLNEVTKVSFENEIKKDDCASVDIDLSEFEEVELNSPESTSKFKKKFFAPVDQSELVLDPSKLNS